MERDAAVVSWDALLQTGYGKIPKSIMLDPTLPLESKAIYAYFCALAGSGRQTYPYRDTVLRELGLSKNTYYKYYRPLVERGYLAVEKPADKSAANVYTLLLSPTGKAAGGYGVLPKVVLRDETLSAKAKALYAYLCAYCGDKVMAFPRKADILYHLGISEPTYYKLYNQLWERGYLMAVQRKERGRFGVNDYYIKEVPPRQLQRQSDICDPVCDIENKDTAISDTKSSDAYINNKPLKNNPSHNSLSKSALSLAQTEPDVTDTKEKEKEKEKESESEIMVVSLLQQRYHYSAQQAQQLAVKFWQHFSARRRGADSNISHWGAYVRKALHNWLAETGYQGTSVAVSFSAVVPFAKDGTNNKNPKGRPSYDRLLLEQLLNERAIL